MLRRYPEQEYATFVNNRNTFSTTIFVLASAVQKLARAQPISEDTLLYRSVEGPMDPFARNARGNTEWGFMSATTKREFAAQFSGAENGKPKATMMEIKPTTMDQVASIRLYSQYVLACF
jgi:hypothetical protein